VFGFFEDVARIAVSPVKIAVEVAKPVLRETEKVARSVTKPVADTLDSVADDIKNRHK
jgi:hypothetical protein